MVTDEQIAEWTRIVEAAKREIANGPVYLDKLGDMALVAVPALLQEVERLRGIVRDIAADEPGEEGSGHCHYCCSGGSNPGQEIDGQWHSEECVYRRAVEAMK